MRVKLKREAGSGGDSSYKYLVIVAQIESKRTHFVEKREVLSEQ
jgi:hypothetical protein